MSSLKEHKLRLKKTLIKIPCLVKILFTVVFYYKNFVKLIVIRFRFGLINEKYAR